jgi:hypothetical protein
MQMRDNDLDLCKTAYRDPIDEITLPNRYIAEKDITKPKLPKHVYNGEYIKPYNDVKTPRSARGSRRYYYCVHFGSWLNVNIGIVKVKPMMQ